MARTVKRPFREIAFVGGRFDEAADFLDVDVLNELRIYREIVVETARRLARWSGPEPLRAPPPDFGQDFRLGISGAIAQGSCRARLERIAPAGGDESSECDLFDEAADLIEKALTALRDDSSIPIDTDTRAFMEWGKTLAPSEKMLIGTRIERGAALDAQIRRRLRERTANQNYFQGRKLTGKVVAVALRTARGGGSFKIDLDNRHGATPGAFADEQKSIVIQALQSRDVARLKFRGWCEFSHRSGKMTRIRRIEDCEIIPDSEYTPPPSASESMLKLFDKFSESATESDLSNLPTDGARNYKHYLYGSPKEEDEEE